VIVAIDGYAGTGKSTAARRLAAALGCEVMNTGAMYRAAGVLLPRFGHNVFDHQLDESAIANLLHDWRFELPSHRVLVNGEDVSNLITSEEAGAAASKAGTIRAIRRALQAEQRRLAAGKNYVCEGRDMGTVVFPHAEFKFFLVASSLVRARRRSLELGDPDIAKLQRMIEERDHQDETRSIDPLFRAADAVELDTGTLDTDAVLARMLQVVELISKIE
jgi:CMP/dCMP kinase